MGVEIDRNDLRKINETFKRLDKFAKTSALEYLQDLVFEMAYDLADTHTQSGALISSLYHKKLNANTYEIGADKNRASYAIFVHNGTKPHEIRPKNRKFLRWSGGSGFIFAKKVTHPGYKGDKFLINAVKKSIPKFTAWANSQNFQR